MRYDIHFTTDQMDKEAETKKGLNKTETERVEKKKTKESDKTGISGKEVFGAALVTYGITKTAANIIHNHNQTTRSISGDNYGAMRSQRNKALIEEGLDVGLVMAGGFAVGGIGGALTGLAISYGMKAINHTNDLRKYQADVEIDRVEKEYMNSRLIKNITELR